MFTISSDQVKYNFLNMSNLCRYAICPVFAGSVTNGDLEKDIIEESFLTLRDQKKKWNLIKEQPRTKTGLAKKDVKSNGGQCLLILIGLKNFGMMNSLQNIVILGAKDVDGIKIFDKDDQAIKQCSVILMFCSLIIFIRYQKSWSYQHQEALSTWNSNVLQWDHHDQDFQTYQNQEALAAHLISHLFQQSLF